MTEDMRVAAFHGMHVIVSTEIATPQRFAQTKKHRFLGQNLHSPHLVANSGFCNKMRRILVLLFVGYRGGSNFSGNCDTHLAQDNTITTATALAFKISWRAAWLSSDKSTSARMLKSSTALLLACSFITSTTTDAAAK